MQLGGGKPGRLWTILMIAGGHFAGMVVRVRGAEESFHNSQHGGSSKTKKAGNGAGYEILHHKTFHRYTSGCTALLVAGLTHSSVSTEGAGRFTVDQ